MPNEFTPLVVAPRTLGEVIAAVEGYRNQLSVFSMQALAEIELLKEWVAQISREGSPEVLIELRIVDPEDRQSMVRKSYVP